MIAALIGVREYFERNKFGGDWQAMVGTIARRYPADRHVILNMFHEPFVKKVKSGGAREATPPIKVTKVPGNVAQAAGSRRTDEGCIDCPEHVYQDQGLVIGNEGQGVNAAEDFLMVLHDTTDVPEFDMTTQEGVLDRFMADVEIMTVYAVNNAIEIGKATSPAGIARKIAEHNATNQEEE